MFSFLIKSMNAEYPLSCCKCVEKQTLCFWCSAGLPKCITPPLHKMVPPYSPVTCPPKTPRHIEAQSLLHQEKIDFLKATNFAKSTQMAKESPKVDICQNWPKRVLGDVISCLVSKFDNKIPMGNVPKILSITTLLDGLSVNVNHLINWHKLNTSGMSLSFKSLWSIEASDWKL